LSLEVSGAAMQLLVVTRIENHVLLVECSDRAGLVHAITGVLLRHRCNVTENQEFVDAETGGFFMRTVFTGEIDAENLVTEANSLLPAGGMARLGARGKRRVLVLASHEHHCLAELLVRNRFEEMNGEVVAVVSNHARLRGLTEQFGVPFRHIPAEQLTREEHEAKILEVARELQPECLVLAKYMRVLTPSFVAEFPRRIVNIHHSFLPAFVGAKPYHQAWRRGVKVIGATAHLVTNELDEGPIIAQQVIPVDHTYSAADMARAGRDIEKTVLARALALVLEDKIFLSGNRTVIFD
jgi:formyltetrahydrofolate deformylase